MAESKKTSVGFSFSLGTALLLTLLLLVLKYTVATTIPMWLVFLPMMIWGALLALALLFVAGCLLFAGVCALIAYWLDN